MSNDPGQQLIAGIVALILLNFTAVIGGVVFLIKKIIWLARLEFRVEKLERDINAQFATIKELKDDFKKGA